MVMQPLRSVEQCVDAIVERVGKRISVGTPLGIGKPNHLLNALYRRAQSDRTIELTIHTALSLQLPRAKSELERRLLEPIAARVFGNYPDLAYEVDRAAGRLPPNVKVIEFYMQAGKYVRNDVVQRDYISANFAHVARDLANRGVNVVVQAVKPGRSDGRAYLSLSSNADVTLDLVRALRVKEAAGTPVAIAAQVNEELPFMHGEALREADELDFVVDDPEGSHTLFAPPKQSVGDAETMIGLYASTLVKDGGTLQIGIGALGDAVVYGLTLRHADNPTYRQALDTLGVLAHTDGLHERVGGLARFDTGLFAASEMLVDGFMHLFKSGVLKRKVYDDITLSRLIHAGRIDEEHITPELLDMLHAERAIETVLTRRDLRYLQKFGILHTGLRFEGGELWNERGEHCVPDLIKPDARTFLRAQLGERLQGGAVIHAGFFVGPGEFYQWLRDLSEEQRSLIDMRSITQINQLYGHEELDRMQRREARFFNTTMRLNLLGAACSDSIPDGRVVSGVGGQYEFVAMAHALPGGRSVLQLRSTRVDGGKLQSNLMWNDDRITIPRHLRDIVITEYGCADLRSKTDEECVIALLNITDSRFQDGLAREAVRAGKLRPGYVIPEHARRNLPESYGRGLAELRKQGLFPRYPFGTDLTEDEQTLTRVLKKLAGDLKQPRAAAKLVLKGLKPAEPTAEQERLLERLQLTAPSNPRDALYRRLVLSALQRD